MQKIIVQKNKVKLKYVNAIIQSIVLLISNDTDSLFNYINIIFVLFTLY